jgi:hypothetical protein
MSSISSIHILSFSITVIVLWLSWYWRDARKDRWFDERKFALWALLLSREWEVSETGALIEWRTGPDGRPLGLSDRHLVNLDETRVLLLEVSSAATGKIIRFGVGFSGEFDRPAASLFVSDMREKP